MREHPVLGPYVEHLAQLPVTDFGGIEVPTTACVEVTCPRCAHSHVTFLCFLLQLSD